MDPETKLLQPNRQLTRADGQIITYPNTTAQGDFQGDVTNQNAQSSYIDPAWLNLINRSQGLAYQAAGGTVSQNVSPAQLAAAVSPHWIEGGAYAVGTLVLLGGKLYRCLSAHTATQSNKPGMGANWEEYAQQWGREIATAKSQAINAAAGDATNKADNAESRAINDARAARGTLDGALRAEISSAESRAISAVKNTPHHWTLWTGHIHITGNGVNTSLNRSINDMDLIIAHFNTEEYTFTDTVRYRDVPLILTRDKITTKAGVGMIVFAHNNSGGYYSLLRMKLISANVLQVSVAGNYTNSMYGFLNRVEGYKF